MSGSRQSARQFSFRRRPPMLFRGHNHERVGRENLLYAEIQLSSAYQLHVYLDLHLAGDSQKPLLQKLGRYVGPLERQRNWHYLHGEERDVSIQVFDKPGGLG